MYKPCIIFKCYMHLCLLYCLKDLKKLLVCSIESSQTSLADLYSGPQDHFGGPDAYNCVSFLLSNKRSYILNTLCQIEISAHFPLDVKVVVLPETVLGDITIPLSKLLFGGY